MANFGNANLGFFSGGATGGGGGGGVSAVGGVAPISSSGGSTPNISISQSSGSTNGFLSSTDWTTFNNKVGGSGTQNFVPKWATTGTIGNSQIFDNGTSVGVGTSSPTSTFLLDVNTSALVKTYLQVGNFTVGSGQTGTIITNGIIQSSAGINISGVTGATFNKNGFYPQGNGVDVFCGNNLIANFNLTGNVAGTYTTLRGSFAINGGGILTGTQNELNIFGNVTSTNVTNSVNVNQILINPIISQGVFGTGTLRGIYYNPNLGGGLNTSVHNAWENTSGNIVFGNFGGSALNGRVLQVDTNGKVGVQNGSFNLYNSTSDDIVSATSGGTYLFGNLTSGNRLVFDTSNNAIYFGSNSSSGSPNGLQIFTNTNIVQVGCLTSYTSNPATYLEFDSSNNKFYAWDSGNGVDNGLYVDFPSLIFYFGNYRISNGALVIDATNHTVVLGQSNYNTSGSMEFQAYELKLTGLNLETATPPTGTTPLYLKVTINGIPYLIEAFTP